MVSKRIINNKNIFHIIVIAIIFLMSQAFCQIDLKLDDSCKVSLQCNTGCCKSGKCAETKECKSNTNTVYSAQAIACAALVVIFSIYLIIKLKSIKTDFLEKSQKMGNRNQ